MAGVGVGGSWGLQTGTPHHFGQAAPISVARLASCLCPGHTLALKAHYPEYPHLCYDPELCPPSWTASLRAEQTSVSNMTWLCMLEGLGHTGNTPQAFLEE